MSAPMTLTIWKFPLEILDEQQVSMPRGARTLDVQFQRGRLTLWALVDREQPTELRRFFVIGTGNPADAIAGRRYVGSVQHFDGALVWHIFESH